MKKSLTRIIPVGFVLIVCMAVIGCRSAKPPIAFYTLTSVEAGHVTEIDQNAFKNISIGIGPVKFPEVLDRPQIVTRPYLNRIELSEFNRWGGDLRQDFLDVLTQNISIITGSDQVFKYTSSVNLKPFYRITLDVHQFDGRLGESVLLNVSWVLTINQASPEQQIFKKSVIKQPISGKGYEALVDAQSEAIKILSREIVDEIKRAGI